MSISDSAFNISASPGYKSAPSFMSYAPDKTGAYEILDALVDRSYKPALKDPFSQVSNDSKDQEVKAGKDLHGAWQKARSNMRDTVKLNDQQMTTSDNQGVRRTGVQIEQKGMVADELARAANAMKEIKQSESVENKSGSSRLGGLAKDTVIGAAAGVLAEAVLPGSSGAVAVAAIGAGSIGSKGKSELSAPILKGKRALKRAEGAYQASSGYETKDIMGNSVPNGRAVNEAMSKGPGFDHLPNVIEHEVEPGMQDIKFQFDDEQILELQALANEMREDVNLGREMYNRHLDASVAVTQSTGDLGPQELEVDDGLQSALMSQVPAFQRLAMEQATIKPRFLN